MLRKLANILVLLFFVVSTTGFTISKHYCGGNLVSVSINTEAKSCCGTTDNDCCKNENEIFQLTDDFAAAQILNISPNFSFDINLFAQAKEKQLSLFKDLNLSYVANGPPLVNKQFLFYTHQLKLAPPIC